MNIVESAAILIVYITLAASAQAGAFLLRYDFVIPAARIPNLAVAIPTVIVVKGAVFLLLRLCRSWWQKAGIADLIQLLRANILATLSFTLTAVTILHFDIPRSIYVLDLLLCFLLMAGARFSVRVVGESIQNVRRGAIRTRILIYGAGSAGTTLLREIQSNPALPLQVIGFIDDDPKKAGSIVIGTRVVGTGRDIPQLIERASIRANEIGEVVIAMPSATGRQMREAVANCKSAGIPCKTIPGLGELLTGKVLSAQVRTIAVTDLLGRDPVQLDTHLIRTKLAGHSILITGGAGSIGSELCRQLSRFTPECLVILDQAESDLFRIELELRNRFPHLRIVPCIGDIRDADTVNDVMKRYSSSAVFHAAAYKHVPMMETNVIEALANNVIGTWNVSRAARKQGVEIFLMVSTDKAVRPTNVMGASKRAAELVVNSIGRSASLGSYVSVRFGNVLGSNGSVVPLFQQQIAAGGPVTVTHPDMRRYFMTIPEAVQLVLQASAMGTGTEIFVLNMGESVRIADLARNMIRLAGYEPDKDIEIRYIGTRPGEKLNEELVHEGEHILRTYHDKINIFQAMEVESTFVDGWVSELMHLIDLRQQPALIDHLKQLVPEYQPSKHQGARSRTRAVQISHA